jgi:hypothetical protein
MGVKVTNNAFGTLLSGISSSATTITLDSGQGAKFPTLGGSDFFFATLIDTSNNLEIVKITARSTDSLTAVRAQDNTSARAFSAGDRIELRPTAAMFESLSTPDDATTSSKGIASFSSDNFAVGSGAVTIKDLGVATAEIQANAVTAAKFNADVISGQTELAAEPADTDEFLVSDAGVLKRIDYSHIKGGGGNVLEVLTGVCDGRSVTVPSGTYTMPNVTAVQSLTGSYADLTGSEIAYTPPSGTKQVIYSLQHMFTRDGDYPLAHYKFFVDSDEATRYRTTLYGAYILMLQELRFIISITGSADTTNANLASWTSAKTLKVQAREYTGGSTNTAKAHGLVYWDGAGLSGSGNGFQYKAPILTITALKDS